MKSPKKEKSKISVSKTLMSIFKSREVGITLIIIVVSIIITFLNPVFLSRSNLVTTAIGLSADGIIVIGMAIVLASGALDLSVGAVMGLASVTAGGLYLLGMNIWLAVGVALLLGMFCGMINGYFIGKVGLNPFITTLAAMGMARGASYILTQGSPLSIGKVPKSFEFIGGGRLFGIPSIVIIFVILAVITDFMTRRSEPLRKVFYIGGNEKAAVLSGINVPRVKMSIFIMTALFASIAGILTLSRFHVATPTTGIGAELRAISGAVIGGVSLRGGEGTVLGGVLGIILINIINNALVLLNVSVYWQDFVGGFILLLAVSIDYLSAQRRTRDSM